MKYALLGLIFSTFAIGSADLELQKQSQEFELLLNENFENAPERYRELSLIRLRTVLSFGVNIPAITNLSVNPEIEFFYTK